MPREIEPLTKGKIISLPQVGGLHHRFNAIMTATYWEIGRRVVELEQGGRRRADYGERLIDRLAEDLTATDIAKPTE